MTMTTTEKLPAGPAAGDNFTTGAAVEAVVLDRDGAPEGDHIIETKFGIEEEAVSTAHSLHSVPIDKEPEDASDYPDGGYGWVCVICAFMVSPVRSPVAGGRSARMVS